MHINKVEINKVLNLENLKIDVNKKHLILTGRNGSGKTTLLNELKKYLNLVIQSKGFTQIEQIKNNIKYLKNEVKRLEEKPDKNPKEVTDLISNRDNLKNHQNQLFEYEGKLSLEFDNIEDIFYKLEKNEFVLAFFQAKRFTHLLPSKGVEKIDINIKKHMDDRNERNNANFLKYLVHIKTQQAYANLNSNKEKLESINKWFENFTSALKELYDTDDFSFDYDEENYDFKFHENGKVFGFNTLSDGYSAVIDIISEIMYLMEVEGKYSTNYDFNGIVLIDEIETHLHIDLQKKIMRILINMFPNVQFIISTHSPFILNSVENAIVYDLETRQTINNLSLYSYDRIVETYFNNSKYSKELELKMNRYEQLSFKTEKEDSEIREENKLRNELREISFEMAQEAHVRFKDIEIRRRALDV